MRFNSTEISFAEAIARLSPADRAALGSFLDDADQGPGGADGLTSFAETQDHLDRNPEMHQTVAAVRVMDILAAVTPAPDLSPQGRTFLHIRSALARITHRLRHLETMRDSSPTRAEADAIAKLESELADTVRAASELARDPQFASIAGHANAAIIRISAFRAYGIFADETFRTPPLIATSASSAIACARIELAALRAATEHLRDNTYRVMRAPPPQVPALVDNLWTIRERLELVQPQSDSARRELASAVGDFNNTRRLVATTVYSQRDARAAIDTRKVSEADLPAAFVVTQ